MGVVVDISLAVGEVVGEAAAEARMADKEETLETYCNNSFFLISDILISYIPYVYSIKQLIQN